MIFLRSLSRLRRGAEVEYPFCTPLLQALDRLDFTAPVTVLCGDNGCGKTTLIELIAAALRINRIEPPQPARGESPAGRTDAQRRIWQAAPCYRPSLARRPAHHFFFAAEDFTRYVGYVEAEKRFAQEALREISGKYGSAYADSLAAQPYSGTLDALEHLYGAPLERQSHGQGFLEFFRSRLLPGGLYLMDEPEAALSYVNQLALIYLIQDAVRDGSQFILATHSPILAAIPEAAILEMEEGNLTPRAYEELGLVRFLQHFLRAHAHILASADDSDAEQ